MSKPKLVYFDIDGARGEAARLAMVIGGVPFEDDRVKFADWQARKPHTPFGALPVLEHDGQTVAQSNGINRYVGKLAGLYPNDAWQAALRRNHGRGRGDRDQGMEHHAPAGS